MKAISDVKELTLCRDCVHGERDPYMPQMVLCKINRRWLKGDGYCSDGEKKQGADTVNGNKTQ